MFNIVFVFNNNNNNNYNNNNNNNYYYFTVLTFLFLFSSPSSNIDVLSLRISFRFGVTGNQTNYLLIFCYKLLLCS